MKHLKMLGLCLVAAAALMALAGASSASAASKLCKANESTCAAGNTYGVGTSISASLKAGTVAALQAGPAVVECAASTVAGTTSTESPPSGSISTLSFTSCNHTVHTLQNGALEAVATGGGNGSIKVTGVEVEITIGSTKCKYGGTISTGINATGGNPATVKAEANVPRISGALCNNPAKWTAEYVINTPAPLFVSEN